MGVHWVSMHKMMNGRQTDRSAPSQLMFSKINGRDSLVGAAYGYVTADNDTVRPALFDGNPPWHEHPDLAPPGLNLVMLHVWFVPSPDGPFAGHNPYLPFWALGLTPPDRDRMSDDAGSLRVRKAALGLGEVADTNGLFPILARRPAVRGVLDERRAAIRGLVPQLDSAHTGQAQRPPGGEPDGAAGHAPPLPSRLSMDGDHERAVAAGAPGPYVEPVRYRLLGRDERGA